MMVEQLMVLPQLNVLPENRRILILDDNDANRALLHIVMDMAKITCEEVASGEAAMDTFRPGKFSFAILDIELPGINGLEVAQRIRREDKNIAIIMCSTNDENETIAKAVQADCDMFLVKPLKLDMLLSMIKVMDQKVLRTNEKIMVIDNMQRTRWEERCSTPINKISLNGSVANPQTTNPQIVEPRIAETKADQPIAPKND